MKEQKLEEKKERTFFSKDLRIVLFGAAMAIISLFNNVIRVCLLPKRVRDVFI